MSLAEDGGVGSRGPDLALARLHLRLGSLALARAELETLAGRDGLDQDGLVDLAEARWRTGDIAGAGEAAVAALNDEDGPLLALVVAAEAAAARGRPTEARRLADRAMEAAAGSIDVLFGGMPRASVWPPDAAAPPPSPTTMFDPPRRASSVVHRHPRPHEETGLATATPDTVGGPPTVAAPVPGDEADAATIGLWEAAAATPVGDIPPDLMADVEPAGDADGASDLPTGDTELDLGRAALEAGDPDEAAVRLALVLRVAPVLAPAVLDLIEGRAERGLALVRGDAYRVVGREIEARRAFIEAARGGSWRSAAPEHDADLAAAASGRASGDWGAADTGAHEPGDPQAPEAPEPHEAPEPSSDWSADTTADAFPEGSADAFPEGSAGTFPERSAADPANDLSDEATHEPTDPPTEGEPA